MTQVAGRGERISVVIPTLGGPSLESTIAALLAGTAVPGEILVCIPEREAATLRAIALPHVRVVATPCRGQVAQRAVGFGEAAHPFVLQLDDDLVVAPDCLALLRDALVRFGPGWAVSPSLVDGATGRSVYATSPRASLVSRLQELLLNGREGRIAGRVGRSGDAVGIDPDAHGGPHHDVEWLPGGCVLHRREELVLEAYFPYPGKAYCEDIIHSFHLGARGIRLRVVSAARCAVDVPADLPGIAAFWQDLRADLRARRHYMRLTGRPEGRAYRFALNRILAHAAGAAFRRGGAA